VLQRARRGPAWRGSGRVGSARHGGDTALTGHVTVYMPGFWYYCVVLAVLYLLRGF
jgi:hypothetical protein